MHQLLGCGAAVRQSTARAQRQALCVLPAMPMKSSAHSGTCALLGGKSSNTNKQHNACWSAIQHSPHQLPAGMSCCSSWRWHFAGPDPLRPAHLFRSCLTAGASYTEGQPQQDGFTVTTALQRWLRRLLLLLGIGAVCTALFLASLPTLLSSSTWRPRALAVCNRFLPARVCIGEVCSACWCNLHLATSLDKAAATLIQC